MLPYVIQCKDWDNKLGQCGPFLAALVTITLLCGQTMTAEFHTLLQNTATKCNEEEILSRNVQSKLFLERISESSLHSTGNEIFLVGSNNVLIDIWQCVLLGVFWKSGLVSLELSRRYNCCPILPLPPFCIDAYLTWDRNMCPHNLIHIRRRHCSWKICSDQILWFAQSKSFSLVWLTSGWRW